MRALPAHDGRSLERASDEVLAACPEVPGCREILLCRYERKIRQCAWRMSLDRVDAEDLAQETFVRVLEALPGFQGRSRFDTWLTRIARNTCIDQFRRARTRRARRYEPADTERFWAEQPAGGEGPVAEVMRASLACHLDEAIAALPEGQRRVAELALIEGLPREEIAARLGVSIDAVKGRLKRARVQLRRRLADPTPCPLCAHLGGLVVRADGTLE